MRGENQKAIIVMVRDEFLREIDEALPREGYSDRASFIRDAVFEFLAKKGYKLPPILKAPLSHGGRKPKKTEEKIKTDENNQK